MRAAEVRGRQGADEGWDMALGARAREHLILPGMLYVHPCTPSVQAGAAAS